MLVWILTAVDALVVVVAAVCITGLLLPVDHVAGRRLQLRQPPQTAWDAITDVAHFPDWRPGLTRVEQLPDDVEGRASWREYDRHGKITYEVTESLAPTRLATRIADVGLPFGGTWTYDIAPTPDGCTVTVTEHGSVYNPIFRFVSRYIIGPGATIERNLKALATHLGEEAPVLTATDN